MLLFEGLWCHADRDGRLEDRPARLKVQVLPYFEADCNSLIESLKNAGFIERYEVEGRKYIQVLNFTKHQNPHIKEVASTIPAPDKHHTSTGNTGTSPADSLLPLTDSLNPSTALVDAARPKREYTPEFEVAWQNYPKRAGGNPKPKAFKAWSARIKQGVATGAIVNGVLRYATYCSATGKLNTEYVMQAATFFGPDDHYLDPWSTTAGGSYATRQPTDNSAPARVQRANERRERERQERVNGTAERVD